MVKLKKSNLSFRTNHFFLLFRITFTYISKMDSKKDEDNQSLEDLPDEILTLIFGFLIEKRSHEFGILVSTGNCFHAESSSGFLIEKKTLERGENPCRNIMPMTLLSRRMHRIATDPRLWSTFTIYAPWNIERTLVILNMKRMATIQKLVIWLTSQHSPEQIESVLEICARRKGETTYMFQYFNPLGFQPELVTMVETNSELSRSEKESLFCYYKTNVFDQISPVQSSPVTETSERDKKIE